MLDKELIPIKLKNGLIVLISKGEPAQNIESYRGITLNNVDLKIFSKMLHFRLAPYLKDYIHPSQFSAPGRREWELNTLIRDIYQEMEADHYDDSFMVRVDFAKAFDCIDMSFLYKVMEKMGLPRKIIALIKAMDSDVSAKVIVNGAKSKSFKVKRGTRQGDPLSLDKFIIASNPLLCALQNDRAITKYISKSNKSFLALAKADDLTLFTRHLSSVYRMKHTIMRFTRASGLAVNINKTKGFFFQQAKHAQDLKFALFSLE